MRKQILPTRISSTVCLMMALFFFSINQLNAEPANGKVFQNIYTDKSSYKPGEHVVFQVDFFENVSNKIIHVNYLYLTEKIHEEEFNITQPQKNFSWNWLPPETDYKGYLVEVSLIENGAAAEAVNIAVDVSSDWRKFPRYGFLSDFSLIPDDSIKSVIKNLTRHHINGLQFYDWHYKHHQPLKGTADNPASSWKDIANRTNYLSTILSYINAAHSVGMKTMAYNLVYGAYSTAYMDGVKDEWGIYKDRTHTARWGYDLPDNWAADLIFINPGSEDWKQYIFKEEAKVFQAIPFDGWHADQVGDPGTVYDYSGNFLPVGNLFEQFLKDAKKNLGVGIVMNAVNQYGQTGIARTPMDFLYTEVWNPNNNYSDLIRIINNNNNYSADSLQTVLAAYINHDLSGSPGSFNTHSVLFADAVIFSAGASHLELGEHMLGHEYFPNNNLKMKSDLKSALINYYDFLTAYQNILRDDVENISLTVEAVSGVTLSKYQSPGKVYYFGKKKENRKILHLINFANASTLQWVDQQGIQTEPKLTQNFKIKIPAAEKIKSVWFASPDTLNCSPVQFNFTSSEGFIEVDVPSLKYWDMIVIEIEEGTSSIGQSKGGIIENNFYLGQNYPNPFNPKTIIPFKSGGGDIILKIYNVIGERVYQKNLSVAPGYNIVEFNGTTHSSGTYLYTLQYDGKTQTKKMNLLK
ncbi:MAG: T9SS type A sorting domain-containing protein [Ignavibacteriales bacterium]|nr:T9SS type A sorting domain-containing protein [Ignavibacteriales bacterium]